MIGPWGRTCGVCFVGDSFVAGFGDPEHRGWVGRVAAGSAATVYNLGIRRAAWSAFLPG